MKVAVFKHKEERRIGFAAKDSIKVLVDSVAASVLLKQCNYDASGDLMSLIESWPDNRYAQLEKAITRIGVRAKSSASPATIGSTSSKVASPLPDNPTSLRSNYFSNPPRQSSATAMQLLSEVIT